MAKLSKKLFIDELQEQLGKVGFELTKDDARLISNAYTATVEEAVLNAEAEGYDSIGLDWATIKIVDQEAKSGNTVIGGAWSTPAHQVARIKIGNALKNELKARTTK